MTVVTLGEVVVARRRVAVGGVEYVCVGTLVVVTVVVVGVLTVGVVSVKVCVVIVAVVVVRGASAWSRQRAARH